MKRLLLTLAFLVAMPARAEDKTPLRKEFPDVPIIEIEEFLKAYDALVVVDVRSKFEFDVVHIAKAAHAPLSNAGFLSALEGTRAKDSPKTLVTYCNGYRCHKSFEAAKKALEAGFKNIRVLDAGVLPILKTHPEMVTLMGKTPADLKDLPPEDDFKSRLLSASEFKAAAAAAGAVVLDIRDLAQRTKKLDIPNVRSIPLDKILTVLQGGQFKDKDLLVLDAVGKQVEWLNFHLRKNGYSKYRFLKGGVESLE